MVLATKKGQNSLIAPSNIVNCCSKFLSLVCIGAYKISVVEFLAAIMTRTFEIPIKVLEIQFNFLNVETFWTGLFDRLFTTLFHL